MPRKPRGGPDGRPRAQIDRSQFENLCRLSPTIGEVQCYFRVDDMALNAWCRRTYGTTFAEAMQQFSGEGKVSLRRLMWQKAMNQNDRDQWKAIEKLANKHLDMGSAIPAAEEPGHFEVVWRSAQSGKKPEDYLAIRPKKDS